MKVYYAHCVALYNTPQEERDIDTLSKLGFEVLNPNTELTSRTFKARLSGGKDYITAFERTFHPLIDQCAVFAFKALPDGRIPGGVAMELEYAQEKNKLIIELPSYMITRMMGKDDTIEYLKDVGQR